MECKSKFDELAKIMLKLNLCRKELREYDRQFKSPASVASLNPPPGALSRKPSSAQAPTSAQPRNTCFGCASANVQHCLTLFRVLLCSAQPLLVTFTKSELCRQGVLEDLINFNLKRSLLLVQAPTTAAQPATPPPAPPASAAPAAAAPQPAAAVPSPPISPLQRAHDRDLINLIFLLIRDNQAATDRFQTLLLGKLDAFLIPLTDACRSSLLPACTSQDSPLKYELMLLAALVQRQDDSCWEQRLRLVVHVLLRSLQASRTASPFLMEALTLPCLRILNHVCKTTTNLGLLSSLATGRTPAAQTLRPALSRFYSEPHDTNYAAQPHATLNNNYLACAPGLHEVDVGRFMAGGRSYYEHWLGQAAGEPSEGEAAIKHKYFVAWRKYTLKRRRQYAQMSANGRLYYNLSLIWVRIKAQLLRGFYPCISGSQKEGYAGLCSKE